MKSEDNLWDTGKVEETSSSSDDETSSTLDLSGISPEKNEGEINLEAPKEKDEDWAIPLAEDVEGLNLKTIGIVGTVVILLLTGTLFVLLNETNLEVKVPNEKYEEQINYNVNGFLNFNSNLDVPIPFGFFDNDIIINKNFGIIFNKKNDLKNTLNKILDRKINFRMNKNEINNHLSKFSEKKNTESYKKLLLNL